MGALSPVNHRGLHQGCREAKRNSKRKTMSLKAFRKETPEKNGTSRDEKRLAYVQARKEYRRLIKKLQTSIKNSKVFWGEIRSSLGKRQSEICDNISMEQWSQHFQTIFRTSESHTDTPASDSDGDDILFNELNVPITDNEVRVALSSLKSRKASGHDNVTTEMLKASDKIAVTFNKIFSKGRCPEQWTRSVIVPLFKKGDKDIPNNYRGISLLSVATKCYTTVLRNKTHQVDG